MIVSSEDGIATWTCEAIAADAVALARGLHGRHPSPGTPIVLWAPNSPEWIATSLAVLASGAVLVPVDDLVDEAQFPATLDTSGASVIFTTRRHFAATGQAMRARGSSVFLLDAADEDQNLAPGWRTLRKMQGENPPAPAGDQPAVLFRTSGTTGAPKAFYLTHRNIAANVEAIQELRIVGAEDRALLPLPLHHSYPFVVGMLGALSVGTSIVLPGDISGPAILKALRDGEATTIVGVPRLYDALLAAIALRLNAHGWLVRFAWGGLLRLTAALQRETGLPLGRVLFVRVRRGVAPRLRIMLSGGARLAEATAERLEAFGWMVLPGYGLAETAALFTGNCPDAHRSGSAGRPLAGGEIRITHADDHGIGEIELRGPSVTAGYLDNPDADRATFTPDGWFRTGDLGHVDRDGYLFITGRAKEILVLGGGKKVNPEDLERVYGAAPGIREIGVLEDQGTLVALVWPDAGKLREMGSTNVRDGVRIVLAESAQRLPSYERLSGFALIDEALPRTRLGKFRRFLLHDLYTEALAGGHKRTAHLPHAEDVPLLADPAARAVWDFLRQRYPTGAVDLDVNPSLDLSLDSFAWMELAVALQDRFGVQLSDVDIASIETIRDLVRRCVERQAGTCSATPPSRQAPAIAEDIDRWLAPTGVLLTTLGVFLYGVNWLVMRGLFRLRVSGLDHVPAREPFVIAPNHVSDLDAMAIAAALPLCRLRRIYWAADVVRLFYNAASRMFCRALHLFPVDERHPEAAVRAATRVLQSGHAQVWFPEGWRSPDGQLQRFLPGIGQLLLRTHAPAVPSWIGGAFEALPRGKRIPKFRRVTLAFGPPVSPETLCAEGVGRTDEERVARALRDRVVALAGASGAAVEGAPS